MVITSITQAKEMAEKLKKVFTSDSRITQVMGNDLEKPYSHNYMNGLTQAQEVKEQAARDPEKQNAMKLMRFAIASNRVVESLQEISQVKDNDPKVLKACQNAMQNIENQLKDFINPEEKGPFSLINQYQRQYGSKNFNDPRMQLVMGFAQAMTSINETLVRERAPEMQNACAEDGISLTNETNQLHMDIDEFAKDCAEMGVDPSKLDDEIRTNDWELKKVQSQSTSEQLYQSEAERNHAKKLMSVTQKQDELRQLTQDKAELDKTYTNENMLNMLKELQPLQRAAMQNQRGANAAVRGEQLRKMETCRNNIEQAKQLLQGEDAAKEDLNRELSNQGKLYQSAFTLDGRMQNVGEAYQNLQNWRQETDQMREAVDFFSKMGKLEDYNNSKGIDTPDSFFPAGAEQAFGMSREELFGKYEAMKGFMIQAGGTGCKEMIEEGEREFGHGAGISKFGQVCSNISINYGLKVEKQYNEMMRNRLELEEVPEMQACDRQANKVSQAQRRANMYKNNRYQSILEENQRELETTERAYKKADTDYAQKCQEICEKLDISVEIGEGQNKRIVKASTLPLDHDIFKPEKANDFVKLCENRQKQAREESKKMAQTIQNKNQILQKEQQEARKMKLSEDEIKKFNETKSEYSKLQEKQKKLQELQKKKSKFAPALDSIDKKRLQIWDKYSQVSELGYRTRVGDKLSQLNDFIPEQGKGKNSDHYNKLLKAMQDARKAFSDPNAKLSDQISSINNLQSMAGNYLKEKQGQFRPWPSEQRLARMNGAAMILEYCKNTQEILKQANPNEQSVNKFVNNVKLMKDNAFKDPKGRLNGEINKSYTKAKNLLNEDREKTNSMNKNKTVNRVIEATSVGK